MSETNSNPTSINSSTQNKAVEMESTIQMDTNTMPICTAATKIEEYYSPKTVDIPLNTLQCTTEELNTSTNKLFEKNIVNISPSSLINLNVIDIKPNQIMTFSSFLRSSISTDVNPTNISTSISKTQSKESTRVYPSLPILSPISSIGISVKTRTSSIKVCKSNLNPGYPYQTKNDYLAPRLAPKYRHLLNRMPEKLKPSVTSYDNIKIDPNSKPSTSAQRFSRINNYTFVDKPIITTLVTSTMNTITTSSPCLIRSSPSTSVNSKTSNLITKYNDCQVLVNKDCSVKMLKNIIPNFNKRNRKQKYLVKNPNVTDSYNLKLQSLIKHEKELQDITDIQCREIEKQMCSENVQYDRNNTQRHHPPDITSTTNLVSTTEKKQISRARYRKTKQKLCNTVMLPNMPGHIMNMQNKSLVRQVGAKVVDRRSSFYRQQKKANLLKEKRINESSEISKKEEKQQNEKDQSIKDKDCKTYHYNDSIGPMLPLSNMTNKSKKEREVAESLLSLTTEFVKHVPKTNQEETKDNSSKLNDHKFKLHSNSLISNMNKENHYEFNLLSNTSTISNQLKSDQVNLEICKSQENELCNQFNSISVSK